MVGHKTQITLYSLFSFSAGFLLAKELDRMSFFAGEVMESATVARAVQVLRSPAPPPEIKALSDAELLEKRGSASLTDFDRIVAAAYKTATTSQRTAEKKTFNIDWWEKASGLTTTGGLNKQDRILLSQLYGNANSVFEWGLGESTYMANYLGVPRYAGIDSDPVWVDMARNKVSGEYRFYFADIGKTVDWGWPSNQNLTKNVFNYQLEPLIVEQEAFDVYMVDGRFRLPCALAAFLHASARGGDKLQTTVLIHDCDAQEGGPIGRDIYKAADSLLAMVNHSGQRLCVYKRKPETTDAQIAALWFQHVQNLQRR